RGPAVWQSTCANHHPRIPSWRASDLCDSRLCRSRRFDELWNAACGYLSTGRYLRRPHSKGREACRPAGSAGDQIRIRHQHSNGANAEHRGASRAARHCRRGDRVIGRREFITLLGGAAAWPIAARAQQGAKVPRIGYLSPGSASPGPLAYHDEFQRELRELGYVEGRNIVVEYRFADGKFDRLDQLAAGLVRLNAGVIVSVVTQASLAAKNATSTIPIVIVSVADPVGGGLVASLARPGGNVTGTSAMTSEVIGKSLGLLKQTVPMASPVAVLWNPNNV